jgi:hypothetical protein
MYIRSMIHVLVCVTLFIHQWIEYGPIALLICWAGRNKAHKSFVGIQNRIGGRFLLKSS